MKKIIAIILTLAMVIPFAACNNANTTTSTPYASETPATSPATEVTSVPTASKTDAETSAPETTTETLFETPIFPGAYVLKHNESGVSIQSDKSGNIVTEGEFAFTSIDWVVMKQEQFYRIGLFGIETVKNNDNAEMIYNNAEVQNTVAITALTDGSQVKKKTANLTDNYSLWRVIENDDGSFEFSPRLKKSFRLSYSDGKFIICEYDEAKEESYKFSVEKVKNEDNNLFNEFVSEKGNVVVRVPKDVFDAKNYTSVFDSVTLKSTKYVPTEETIQKYADRTQLIYETYIDLTAYTPYYNIFVHAYNYQGVMAGVCGNNNNVYVNCGPGEWFYSDLSKMQYRNDVLGRDDYNFMVLHEMGHMFDWNRGWTFESEMQADLKAAYFLNTTDNAYAAPAEYAASTCFHETIGSEGFKGLSGGSMSYSTTKDNYGYSIYRFAQIIVEYVQKYAGWEAVRDTFHWYQNEAEDIPSSSETWARFELFLSKITEFGNAPTIDLEGSISEAEMKVMEAYFKKPETPEPTVTAED